MTSSLRESLSSWTDRDMAMFRLGVALGIFEQTVSFARDAKHVFWSENKLGASLAELVQTLVRIGALEMDSEEEQVRWNQSFEWRASAR